MSRASILLLSLIVALPAAADVYQWRDAQGRIHYSDTPPPQGKVQTLQKSPRPTAPVVEETAPAAEGTPAADAKAQGDKDKADPNKPKTVADKELEFRQRRAAAAESEAKAEKARQEQESLKVECERARGQLAALQNSRRMARYTSTGERELMDDAARKSESDRVQKYIDTNCK